MLITHFLSGRKGTKMTDQEHLQELQTVLSPTTAMPSIERIVDMAVNGLDSAHSKRAYRRALADFLEWYTEHGGGLTKATVNDYRAWMVKVGVPESSINQRLTAIRRLAREAADNNSIDDATARSIERVKGIAWRGTPVLATCSHPRQQVPSSRFADRF
jgi:hypothetical protein